MALNTWLQGYDETVVLEAGEHPFVKHKTIVTYELMTSIYVGELGLKDSDFHKPLNSYLINRVVEGVYESENTPKNMIAALNARLGVEY